MCVVIAVSACKPPEPVAPAAPAECAGDWAIAELAALKAHVKSDPATAMNRLGVDVDEFEPVAKALYKRWLEKHPEAQPKPASPPPPPPPRPTSPAPMRVPFDTVSWWCFEDPEWGDCSLTKSECEESRSRIASAGYCERWSGDTNAVCIATLAATLQVSECSHQERVACFSKHHILRDMNSQSCAPSLRTCKARRTNVLKKLSDDIRVTSECKPEN